MNRALALLLCALALSACGSDELLAGVPEGDGGGDSGVLDAAPDVDAAPGIPRRSVIERNPFGNVAASDNLLWDGDFEWHSAFASQYGWIDPGSAFLGGFSSVRVGADCRSGMKCAALVPHQKIAAIGVSPSDELVAASVWSKPSSGDCLDTRVLLIACDWGADPDLPLLDADGLPDEQGWCRHELVAEPRKRASCLLVEARLLEGQVLIDDAVVRAAAPGSRPSLSAFVPDALDSARAGAARATLREWLKPGRAREPQARRALERWQREGR
jgi:hypothetical protein